MTTNTQNQWALHTAQQEMLQKEAESQPLIGEYEKGFSSLETQFENASSGFKKGLQAIKNQHYVGLRRIRGDGNCFFRGFMFRLIEIIVTQKKEEERKRLCQFMKDSIDYLLSAGYERVGVETFQEMMVELFEEDVVKMKTGKDVETLFSNKGESEHIVWYSRVLCAAYMKKNSDRFFPFLQGDWANMDEYCAHEVEPQGKECEEPQMIALAEILQIGVRVEYLSASTNQEEGVSCSLGPETSSITIKFVYTPGHYNVLYD